MTERVAVFMRAPWGLGPRGLGEDKTCRGDLEGRGDLEEQVRGRASHAQDEGGQRSIAGARLWRARILE